MANDISRVGSARSRASGLATPAPEPRANSAERARDKVTGWLPETAKKSDPSGTTYTEIGPSSKYWRAASKAK
jgi:hypothetical protein